jgi:ATP-binding cassette subfamily B protein
VIAVAAILAATGLLSAVSPYATRYLQAELGRRAYLTMQSNLYTAINSFPGLNRFESPEFFDEIQIVRQINDNTVIRMLTSFLSAGQSIITLIGFAAALAAINPLLSGIVALSALPAFIIQLRNSRLRNELNVQNSPGRRRQLFYGRLLGDQEAAKEVRIFGLGEFLKNRMLQELRSINSNQRALDVKVLRAEGVLSFGGALISAAGLIWVAREAAIGALSLGDVSMFAISILGVQTSIASLVTGFASTYQTLNLFTHYFNILTAGPDLPLSQEPIAPPVLSSGIEFCNVWFRYDSNHPWILQGVNLFIPSGSSVALVGLNGAGKSTLIRLLCRLHDPDVGYILWDGIDIRDFAPEDLRARIGAIFQDYMSYDLTVTENIGLGDLPQMGNREKIQRASAAAGMHEKLDRLPNGYNTLLSRMFYDHKDRENPETGVALSGGEWQRLAIARGMMRAGRDLLILDEPSAGLDAAAEHEINEQLRIARNNRTMVLISHRLSTVKGASIIYVLSGGKVAERGDHRELMRTQGQYYNLFTLQANGYIYDSNSLKGKAKNVL